MTKTAIEVQRGEVWILPGHAVEHRLMCGSAFQPHDVKKLLGDTPIGLALVDPPYTPVETFRDVEAQFLKVWAALELAAPARAGVWCGWAVLGAVLATGRDYDPNWVFCLAEGEKQLFVNELVVWALRRPNRFYVRGIVRIREALNAPRRHPAEKGAIPIAELFAMAKADEVAPAVYDPFSGSGRFLEAADAAGRPGYGMEVDPAVASAIVNGWTAGTPRRDVDV